MKHTVRTAALLILSAAMLSGCSAAENSSTPQQTTTVGTSASTTAAETTSAVTEAAEPPASTEQQTTASEAPAEPETVEEPTEPETLDTPTAETQETPTAETVTVNGVEYAIADSDIQNSDGTFTQQLGHDNVKVPEELANYGTAWTVETAANRTPRPSNPSQIPYSQITLENAAEAFPYLGFIGYRPDYIEIMPGDTEKQIASKVWNNLAGTKCAKYFDYSNPLSTPTHNFATEEEYLAYKQAEEEARARLDAAQAQASANIASGNTGWDETPEELAEIFGW